MAGEASLSQVGLRDTLGKEFPIGVELQVDFEALS